MSTVLSILGHHRLQPALKCEDVFGRSQIGRHVLQPVEKGISIGEFGALDLLIAIVQAFHHGTKKPARAIKVACGWSVRGPFAIRRVGLALRKDMSNVRAIHPNHVLNLVQPHGRIALLDPDASGWYQSGARVAPSADLELACVK